MPDNPQNYQDSEASQDATQAHKNASHSQNSRHTHTHTLKAKI